MTQPDLSEFYRLSRPKKKPCQLGYAKTLLSKKDTADLDAALAIDNGIITASAIVQWLEKREHSIIPQTVVSHRRKCCSCYDA